MHVWRDNSSVLAGLDTTEELKKKNNLEKPIQKVTGSFVSNDIEQELYTQFKQLSQTQQCSPHTCTGTPLALAPLGGRASPASS